MISNTTMDTSLNIREPRVQRQRLCGHCRQPGHDRRRCPDPVMVERRAAEAENRRLAMQALEATRQDLKKAYRIHNNNPYSVYLYWSSVGSDTVKYFRWVEDGTDFAFLSISNHRIMAIPTSEFTFTPTQGSEIKLSESDYFIAGDFNVDDFEDGHIHIIKEYVKSKTELEMWKECAFKSHQLLKEIERLGGKQNPNIEPILDMVQDIILPPHTEMDKELAGVPSIFNKIK